MKERVKYDENFFVKYSKEIPLDFSLPFKLQKRQLLEKLGFPIDKSLLIPVVNLNQIRITLSEWFKKNTSFMIGLHLNPLPTCVTPFFLIGERKKKIKYHDEMGAEKIVTRKQILKKINEISPKSWVEFIKPIWGPTTIAGRMIYFSSDKQLIEIQKGVFPDKIGNDREKFPYFTVELEFFQIDFRNQSRLGNLEIREVKSVIRSLEKHLQGFENLLRIAEMPTLELGYMQQDKKLVIIDIDWPRQYQY